MKSKAITGMQQQAKKTYKYQCTVDWCKDDPEPQVCFLIVYLLCSQDDISDPICFAIKISYEICGAWCVISTNSYLFVYLCQNSYE